MVNREEVMISAARLVRNLSPDGGFLFVKWASKNSRDQKREPIPQNKGKHVGRKRKENNFGQFVFFFAEAAEQGRKNHCLHHKHNQFQQNIAKHKGPRSGIVVDDVERHIQNHLGGDIGGRNKGYQFLFPESKKQSNGKFQQNGQNDPYRKGNKLPGEVVTSLCRQRRRKVGKIDGIVTVKGILLVNRAYQKAVAFREIEQNLEDRGRALGPAQLIAFRAVPPLLQKVETVLIFIGDKFFPNRSAFFAIPVVVVFRLAIPGRGGAGGSCF